MPLFLLLAGAVPAHLGGAAVAMGALRLLRGWIELEEVGALAVACLASGCGATAVEALWRAGRPRLALLAGGIVGPAMLFGALFGATRLLGRATPQALEQVGDVLGTPTGPWLLALLALLAAAGLGPLVHHRLRGSPPAQAVGGALLALLLVGLSLAPPELSASPRPWALMDALVTLTALALAVATIAHAQAPAQALAASLAGRLGLGPPAAGPDVAAWGRARLGALRALLRREPPWAATEERVRAALHAQAAVLDRVGRVLWLAAGLELLAQLVLARAPALRGDLARALALRGPEAERLALTLARAGPLLLLLGALLVPVARAGWRPSPRTASLCLGGAVAEAAVLLLGGEVRAATLGILAPLALLLAAGVAGVLPLRLALPLLGGYLALAAYPRAAAAEIGLLLDLPLPGSTGPGPALAWGLLGLALVALPGLGWGLPWVRLLAVASGAAAGGALAAHPRAGWVQDEVWLLLPAELWAVLALPALAAGAAGALLWRGLPRAGPVLTLALATLALVASPPWGSRAPHEPSSAAAAEVARVAAEAGDPRAMHRWGCLLLRGREVPRHRSEGRGWVERAARAGWPGAVERLTWEDEAAAELDAARQ